jgi:HK97 family phage portal protein
MLNPKIHGPENAGKIAFVNRDLKFSPWQMSNADLQFIESRTFQVEEVARIIGVPPHLLMATEKVTSWGAGLAEQDLALAKYTFKGHTSRIESALQAILPADEYLEFEYKGLLSGTPKDEIELIIAQVSAQLLTVDEGRALLNRPALPPTPPGVPT